MRQLMFKLDSIIREIRYWRQRCTRGYADTDWFNADYTIAKKALPLVRELRANNYHTLDEDDKDGTAWEAILDEIIFALDYTVNHQYDLSYTTDDHLAAADRAQAGYELMGKYFMKLWG